ncbi:hypothetical protein N9C06_06250 [Salibacteraceae bacterium]|nr:hypothetical protein [Salibacteraceae bacterium]
MDINKLNTSQEMRVFLKLLALAITTAILFSSCSTSNDVVSNSFLSKRKYRKGFHVNLKSNKVKPAARISAESLAQETDVFAQAQELQEVNIEVQKAPKDKKSVEYKAPKNGGLAQKIQTLKQLKKLSKEIKAMSKEDFMASIDQIENQPNLAPADDMSTEDIFALVAFIGALLAIVGTVIPFIGFLGWLAALIFGFLGLKSEKWQWMAIVGVVVGLLILLLVILLLIFVLLLGASIGAW